MKHSTIEEIQELAANQESTMSATTAKLVEEAMTYRRALTIQQDKSVQLPEINQPPIAMTKWVSTPEQFWYQ